jgi:hypothetical protein
LKEKKEKNVSRWPWNGTAVQPPPPLRIGEINLFKKKKKFANGFPFLSGQQQYNDETE